MMKYIRALVLSCMNLIVLIVVYNIHINYFRVNVVFYAAIADVFIAALICTPVMLIKRNLYIFNNFEKIQLIAIWCLFGYAIAISVPTVIDRSLSLYILEKLQQRGGGIRQEAMADVFTQEYLKEHRLVDVRLTEQLESGTITIVNNCVKLTEKGAGIAAMSRYFRQHMLPKQRLLMGEYSADLTNPFRNSDGKVSYICD